MKKLSGFEHFEPKRQRVEPISSQVSRNNGALFNSTKSSSSSSAASAILNLLSSLETVSDSSFVVGAVNEEHGGTETVTSSSMLTNSFHECSSTLASSLPFCSALVISALSLIDITKMSAAFHDFGEHSTWTSEFSFFQQNQQSTSSSTNLQRLQTAVFHLLHRNVGLHSFWIQGTNSLPSGVFYTDVNNQSYSHSCLLSGLTQADIDQRLSDLGTTYYVVDNVEDGESSTLTSASANAVLKRRKKGKSTLLTGEHSWRIGAHIILDIIRSRLSSTASSSRNNVKTIPSCIVIANQTFPFASVNTPLIETLSFEEKNSEDTFNADISSSSLSWLFGTGYGNLGTTKSKSSIKHTVRISGFLNHFLIIKLVAILSKEVGKGSDDEKVVVGLPFLHSLSHMQQQKKKKLIPLISTPLELQSTSSIRSNSLARQQYRGMTQQLINPFAVVTGAPRPTSQFLSDEKQAIIPKPKSQEKLIMRFETFEAAFKDLTAIVQIIDSKPELCIEEGQLSAENEIQFAVQTIDQLYITFDDDNIGKAMFELTMRNSALRLTKPRLQDGKDSRQDTDGITLDPMKKYEVYVDNSIF